MSKLDHRRIKTTMRLILVLYPRTEYSRLRAWMEARRSHYTIEGYEVKIPDHWWRKRHSEHAWGYTAVFAPHPDGPDTMENYRGEKERGFLLEESW